MIPHVKPGQQVLIPSRKRPHKIVIDVNPVEFSNILLSSEVERKYFLKWMDMIYPKVDLEGWVDIQIKLPKKI